jgi:hypothetical protein
MPEILFIGWLQRMYSSKHQHEAHICLTNQCLIMSEMKLYFGSKRIKAKPMNRLEYNQYRGWELSSDENGADEGYLVEYLDGGESNHKDHSGYISWSPKDIFERAYRRMDNLTFGEAVELAKQGYLLCRAGWNGKRMFVFLRPEFRCPAQVVVESIQSLPQEVKDYYQKRYQEADGTWTVKASDYTPFEVQFNAYFTMKGANDELINGWLASQTDMLAEDWQVFNV